MSTLTLKSCSSSTSSCCHLVRLSDQLIQAMSLKLLRNKLLSIRKLRCIRIISCDDVGLPRTDDIVRVEVWHGIGLTLGLGGSIDVELDADIWLDVPLWRWWSSLSLLSPVE